MGKSKKIENVSVVVDKKKSVYLTLGQKIQIVNYLKGNRERIETGELTRQLAADELTGILKVKVNVAHLLGPIKEADVVFPYGGVRVKLVEFDVRTLMTLTAAVTDLYIRLDETMPKGLAELKESLTTKIRETLQGNGKGVAK